MGSFINYKTHQNEQNLGKDIVGALWVKEQKTESQMEKREKGQSYKWASEVTSRKNKFKSHKKVKKA